MQFILVLRWCARWLALSMARGGPIIPVTEVYPVSWTSMQLDFNGSPPFMDDFPVETSIYRAFSVIFQPAMLDYQMVRDLQMPAVSKLQPWKLLSNCRYFTADEIHGLFEWTDPAEGETRKLLRDMHGIEDSQLQSHQVGFAPGTTWNSSSLWFRHGFYGFPYVPVQLYLCDFVSISRCQKQCNIHYVNLRNTSQYTLFQCDFI